MANSDKVIFSSRLLNSSRELVFRAFQDPTILARWWGPKDFTNTFEKYDLRPGGDWLFVMHGPDGTGYRTVKKFLEVSPPELITFEHLEPMHGIQMRMSFDEEGARTRLGWRMEFESIEEAERVRPFVEVANEENFDRLEAELAAMS